MENKTLDRLRVENKTLDPMDTLLSTLEPPESCRYIAFNLNVNFREACTPYKGRAPRASQASVLGCRSERKNERAWVKSWASNQRTPNLCTPKPWTPNLCTKER